MCFFSIFKLLNLFTSIFILSFFIMLSGIYTYIWESIYKKLPLFVIACKILGPYQLHLKLIIMIPKPISKIKPIIPTIHQFSIFFINSNQNKTKKREKATAKPPRVLNFQKKKEGRIGFSKKWR